MWSGIVMFWLCYLTILAKHTHPSEEFDYFKFNFLKYHCKLICLFIRWLRLDFNTSIILCSILRHHKWCSVQVIQLVFWKFIIEIQKNILMGLIEIKNNTWIKNWIDWTDDSYGDWKFLLYWQMNQMKQKKVGYPLSHPSEVHYFTFDTLTKTSVFFLFERLKVCVSNVLKL